MHNRRFISKTTLKIIVLVVAIIFIFIFSLLAYGGYKYYLYSTAPYSTPHGGERHADKCWVPKGRENCAPHYIIAGAMKCGTTSLFSYLTNHPEILSLRSFVIDPSEQSRITAEKEVRYFIDPTWTTLKLKYGQEKSVNLYLDLFEEIPSPNTIPHPDPEVEKNRGKITGEATPMYICQPGVAKRVYDVLPHVKIILMLRNPVDRAYSEFWFKRALSGRDKKRPQNESLSLEKIETYQRLENRFLQYAFSQCVKNDLEMMKYCKFEEALRTSTTDRFLEFSFCYLNLTMALRTANPDVDPICDKKSPVSHLCLNGRIRRNCPMGLAINSVYTWQIGDWLGYFPLDDQMMVIQSELFYNDTNNMMNDVTDFLDISRFDWTNITTKKYNIVNANAGANRNNTDNNNNNNNNNNAAAKSDQGLVIQDKSNDYPDLDPDVRADLEKVFEPYNQRLYRQLNKVLW